nr:glycoside hydrolase family 15 protein [Nocardia brevicatena]
MSGMTSSGPPPQVLREYALLADGERGVVVGPLGDFIWLCVPRWDSDPVFAGLIGGPGRYGVTPVDRFVWGGYYERGTLIWRSRWVTHSAIIECREALAFPGDPARAVLLRQVHAVKGDARLDVDLAPVAGFGHAPLRRPHRDDDGRWYAEVGDLRLRWSPGTVAAVAGRGTDRHLHTTITVPEGGHHDLILELSTTRFDGPPPEPETAWAATETSWKRAMPRLGPMAAPHDTRHAYAVLQGLTSAGGGMVAAATMCLPERARKGRNFDYRYVWIRDQCYTGQAVAADGPHPLLDAAVRLVTARLLEDGPHLMPAYTVAGEPVPEQRPVELAGYPGGSDIIGNRVRRQFQLDTFGEALLLFAAAARHDRLDRENYRAIGVAIDAIEKRWRDPDAGVWEIEAARWAQSRLICAAGLRAVARDVAGAADAASTSAPADALVAETARDCLHPSGRRQRAPDDERLDASLLLPAIRGAVPASDPRTVATFEAVCRHLSRDGYVFRYRSDGQPLGTTEGAFLLCGFLVALAADQQNRPIRAFRFFERNRAACGPPGLFSEEYDITQRQMRGNLPQAFVHALMFEASCRLGRHEEGREPGDDVEDLDEAK